MDDIRKGTHIEVTDALGRTFAKRAVSDVEHAGRFPAVWACNEEEWTNARLEGREPEPEPFPWPTRSVRILSGAP